MRHTDTIIIGGGQAGLAVSHCLTHAGRDHVVLERGRLGESWRTQRWDSLRLLSPNWMTRLPGWSYAGNDPDGFMAARELVGVLERYARSFAGPVEEQTTVEAVEWDGERYTVLTDQGSWRSDHLVVATGHCMHPFVPPTSSMVAASVLQLTPDRYRRPEQLPEGGVLVVGASATGAQLAEELALAGREVVLAVGEHSRLPRTYRGLDIFWWLDQAGILDESIDAHPNPVAAARAPSMQLVGSPGRRNLDLSTCRDVGVHLAGRLGAIDGTQATFQQDLDPSVRRAQERTDRLLDRIDRYIRRHGLTAEVEDPARPAPIDVGSAPVQVDLADRKIATVLWATGFERRYPWLPAAALDAHGAVRHHHGIGVLPGLYVVGLRFQRSRSSNFISGVGRDAQHLVNHLTERPAGVQPCVA